MAGAPEQGADEAGMFFIGGGLWSTEAQPIQWGKFGWHMGSFLELTFFSARLFWENGKFNRYNGRFSRAPHGGAVSELPARLAPGVHSLEARLPWAGAVQCADRQLIQVRPGAVSHSR